MMSSLLLKPKLNNTLTGLLQQRIMKRGGRGLILEDKVGRTVSAFDFSGFAWATHVASKDDLTSSQQAFGVTEDPLTCFSIQ